MSDPKQHIDFMFPDGVIPTEHILNWYDHFQPIGSGPTGMMRHICVLIEELAAHRKIILPPARGLPVVCKIKKTDHTSVLGDKIRGLVNDMARHKLSVTNRKPFGDLGMDSVDPVELMLNVQREFSISIPDFYSQEFKCALDIIEYIKLHHPKKQGDYHA